MSASQRYLGRAIYGKRFALAPIITFSKLDHYLGKFAHYRLKRRWRIVPKNRSQPTPVKRAFRWSAAIENSSNLIDVLVWLIVNIVNEQLGAVPS